MGPKGKVQKWLSNIMCASSSVRGPERQPALNSVQISFAMISGRMVAEGRFLGVKVEYNGGGSLMGEPYERS